MCRNIIYDLFKELFAEEIQYVHVSIVIIHDACLYTIYEHSAVSDINTQRHTHSYIYIRNYKTIEPISLSNISTKEMSLYARVRRETCRATYYLYALHLLPSAMIAIFCFQIQTIVRVIFIRAYPCPSPRSPPSVAYL